MEMVCFYLLKTFTTLLRVKEGFTVEAHGLITNVPHGKKLYYINPHVVIPIIGSFNNELGERMYMELLEHHTSSGLKIRQWLDQLNNIMTNENNIRGLDFFQSNG